MTDFDQRMEALRQRFVVRARAQADAFLDAEQAGDHLRMREIAHSLAGNAGLFGYPDLTEAARAVEDALDGNICPEARTRCCRQLHILLSELE